MITLKWVKAVIELLRGLKVAFSNGQVQVLLGLAFSQIGLATVFYHWAEKWSWLDSFYFSVITIATVGYGDLAPTTPLSKIFTMVYILCGIGVFVTATATLASQLISTAHDDLEKMHKKNPAKQNSEKSSS